MIAQIDRYFYGGDRREHFANIEEEDVFRIATLLDPRFKKAGFSLVKNADLAAVELINLVEEVLREETDSAVDQRLIEGDSVAEIDDMNESDDSINLEISKKRPKLDGENGNRQEYIKSFSGKFCHFQWFFYDSRRTGVEIQMQR